MQQVEQRSRGRASPVTATGLPTDAGLARGAGAALVAVLFMGSTLLTPIYDLYRRADGLSPLGLSLLCAVYVLGNLTVLLLLGRLSDHVGRRPVALLGVARRHERRPPRRPRRFAGESRPRAKFLRDFRALLVT